MGRGNNKRTMRRDFKTPRDNSWSEKKAKIDNEQKNESFEEYYKAQGIVPEGQWEDFLAALRRQLPTTFRINGSGQFANDLRDRLQSDFFSQFNKDDIMVDGEKVEAPHPLPWYPNNYAWQFDFSRTQLRKLPLLEGIHEFMKRATDAGTITRQEAVSMVPPLFLDVQPQHTVLDMCAAPGSKTFQLLEAIHAGSGNPAGYVVANDADAQRCNLLTHQTKRMCSPCLLITNHEAQNFPPIQMPQGGALQFDRILCDVPCSGDGTMRKAPDIWRRWSVNSGNGLHLLQIRIALQGSALLKVGGRLVYSTCTFNPIEDEAVVAEVLRRTGGALRLVDVSDHLPALKRLPGKRDWKVKDKFRWYGSWQEAESEGYKLDPSMFPPPPSDTPLPMERCMRFLPHHQNTGGFFVAVLEKVAELQGPVQFPSSQHRYAQKGAQGRKPSSQGAAAEIREGAQGSAVAAVDALGAALAAAEAGDVAAAQAAAVSAQAAAARTELAVSAAAAEAQAALTAPPATTTTTSAAAATSSEANGTAAPTTAPMDIDIPTPTATPTPTHTPTPTPTPTPASPAPTPAPTLADDPPRAETNAAASPASANAVAAAPTWIRGGGGRNRTGGGGRWRGIDPIIPVEDPILLQMVTKFYGLKEDFPIRNHLIVRAQEPQKRPKRLYYIAPQILDLLLADSDEALKITSTGLKIFERQEVRDGTGQCCYRIAQEGLPFLLPHITLQRLQLPLADFLRLLRERSVPIPFIAAPSFQLGIEGATATTYTNGAAKGDTSEGGAAEDAAAGAAEEEEDTAGQAAEAAEEGGAAPAAAGAPAAPKQGPCGARGFVNDTKLDTPEVVEQLSRISYGCAIATLHDDEAKRLGFATGDMAAGALTANAPLAICVWRAKLSVNVLVSKPECSHLVEKIETALAKLNQAEAPVKVEAPVKTEPLLKIEAPVKAEVSEVKAE